MFIKRKIEFPIEKTYTYKKREKHIDSAPQKVIILVVQKEKHQFLKHILEKILTLL